MTEQLLAGRYRLAELLGKGSAGAVWRAEDAVSGAAVAVKITHAEAAANPSLRQRLEREASLVERARCANIVALLDRGTTDDDRPYYVMEYLQGETLHARLDQRDPHPGPRRRIVEQAPLAHAVRIGMPQDGQRHRADLLERRAHAGGL